MKILLVARHNRFTGVNTFLCTLASSIKRRGHELTLLVNDIETSDETVVSKFSEICDVKFMECDSSGYDIIFFSYSDTIEPFINSGASKRFICHGTMFELYVPPKEMDVVYYLSERAFEDSKHTKRVLIRNLVDLQRFSIQSQPSRDLKKILMIEGHGCIGSKNLVYQAAERLGLEFSELGTDRLTWDVEHEISKNDLVFAYGRSAYEAMACGRPVIVYGRNGGDGYITRDRFPKMLRGNCSGWSYQSMPVPGECSVELIIDELKKYDYLDGAENRKLVEQLDIERYIDSLLDLKL